MIFQHTYLKSGLRVSWRLRAQDGNQPWTACPPSRVHSQARPHSFRRADMPVKLARAPLGRGRKLEHPEKTHADMGRPYKLYTDSGPGQKSFYFIYFLINMIRK